jgi:capsid protein
MARDTAPILAMAAETYLRAVDAATNVEQHVTGSDGANYVVTFRPRDGSSPDELRAAAESALAELRAAVGRLADRLDVRARDSRILSVRASLREVATNLRDLVATHPR